MRPSATRPSRIAAPSLSSPSCASSPSASPRTPPLQSLAPWQADPSGFAAATQRRRMLRRSSMSSVTSASSVDTDVGDEAEAIEFTEEDISMLRSTYFDFVALSNTLGTPFTGLPPSQLTQAVARAVCKLPGYAKPLKATRLKLLELAKADSRRGSVEATPKPKALDPEATPKRQRKISRSDSYDFADAHPFDQSLFARCVLSSSLSTDRYSLSSQLQSQGDGVQRPTAGRHNTISSGGDGPRSAGLAPAQSVSARRLGRTTSMQSLNGRLPEVIVEPASTHLGRTASGSQIFTGSSGLDALGSASMGLSAHREGFAGFKFGGSLRRVASFNRLAGSGLSTPFDISAKPHGFQQPRTMPALARDMSTLAVDDLPDSPSASRHSPFTSAQAGYFDVTPHGAPVVCTEPSLTSQATRCSPARSPCRSYPRRSSPAAPCSSTSPPHASMPSSFASHLHVHRLRSPSESHTLHTRPRLV